VRRVDALTGESAPSLWMICKYNNNVSHSAVSALPTTESNVHSKSREDGCAHELVVIYYRCHENKTRTRLRKV
jgi:hypothetical protein